MKIFDCQWDPGMPDDIKRVFFSFFPETRNDSYVEWTIQDERFSSAENSIPYCADENSEHALNKKKIDAWLIEHGANPAENENSEGETVLIKHWW